MLVVNRAIEESALVEGHAVGTAKFAVVRPAVTLWRGVEPKEIFWIYRTYWSILDRDDPSRVVAAERRPLLEPDAELTRPIEDLLYLRDVVFTTGLVDGDEDDSGPGHYIVASGEADLACRITHIAKDLFA